MLFLAPKAAISCFGASAQRMAGTRGTFALHETEAGVTGLSARYDASPADSPVAAPVFRNFGAARTQRKSPLARAAFIFRWGG